MNISELTKRGWIEVDPNQDIDRQASIGDLLITTEMYMFKNTYSDLDIDVEVKDLNDMKESLFTILNLDGRCIQMIDKNEPNEDEWWFEPMGRVFIKKQNMKYVTLQVPSFLRDKIIDMGGKEVE